MADADGKTEVRQAPSTPVGTTLMTVALVLYPALGVLGAIVAGLMLAGPGV